MENKNFRRHFLTSLDKGSWPPLHSWTERRGLKVSKNFKYKYKKNAQSVYLFKQDPKLWNNYSSLEFCLFIVQHSLTVFRLHNFLKLNK